MMIKKGDFVKIKNDPENAVYQVLYVMNLEIPNPFAKLSNDEYVLLSDLILFNPKND